MIRTIYSMRHNIPRVVGFQ